VHKNKDIFLIDKNDPAAYFVSKQLQYNIKKTCKVRQSNYYNIVNQLKNILFTTFPKYVIKTDIKSFYETINTSKLISKIKEDTPLSIFSKKIITNVLHQYRKISKSDKGIPRGIRISVYLAEIYMQDFDEYIKFMDNVIFYSRYVDDIIIVFVPKPN
jgi:hypothetical protein